MFKIIFRKYRKGGIVMKNYISINNQKTALTDEQVAQIRAAFGLSDTKLSDVAVGDTVKIGQQELICKGWFLPPNTYDCGSFVVN